MKVQMKKYQDKKNIRKKVVLAQFPEPPKASNFEITTKDTLIKSVDNNAASVSFILPVQTSSSKWFIYVLSYKYIIFIGYFFLNLIQLSWLKIIISLINLLHFCILAQYFN